MPTYTYKDVVTGEEQTLLMSIHDMELFEQANVQFKRVLKPIPIGDSIRLGITTNPTSFNDLVKEVKKNNYGSNINSKNGEF